MRLVFLGTPEAAVPSLEALVAAGHDLELVVTQPDRRRGRGGETSASPVKAAATRLGLRVADSLGALEGVEAQWGIVVAYGALIPASLLARIPMLNVHFSLLPRWRGAAPVERAILAGDRETGVGIISLEATLDTGPLHAEGRTLIAQKTSSELTGELAQMGARLVTEVLASEEMLSHPWPQVGESTYAAKLTPETFHLSPEMSAQQALRVVQLERAYFKVQGQRLRILRAAPGDAAPGDAAPGDAALAPGALVGRDATVYAGFADAALELSWVQPEGSRTMSGAAWWAGARFAGSVTWE